MGDLVSAFNYRTWDALATLSTKLERFNDEVVSHTYGQPVLERQFEFEWALKATQSDDLSVLR